MDSYAEHTRAKRELVDGWSRHTYVVAGPSAVRSAEGFRGPPTISLPRYAHEHNPSKFPVYEVRC